jgi:hypothetical protein
MFLSWCRDNYFPSVSKHHSNTFQLTYCYENGYGEDTDQYKNAINNYFILKVSTHYNELLNIWLNVFAK